MKNKLIKYFLWKHNIKSIEDLKKIDDDALDLNYIPFGTISTMAAIMILYVSCNNWKLFNAIAFILLTFFAIFCFRMSRLVIDLDEEYDAIKYSTNVIEFDVKADELVDVVDNQLVIYRHNQTETINHLSNVKLDVIPFDLDDARVHQSPDFLFKRVIHVKIEEIHNPDIELHGLTFKYEIAKRNVTLTVEYSTDDKLKRFTHLFTKEKH